MSAQDECKGNKQGRRMHALRECFHRALKIALSCPTWEVQHFFRKEYTLVSLCGSIAAAVQEFSANFETLPDHYVASLFDLLQQVWGLHNQPCCHAARV